MSEGRCDPDRLSNLTWTQLVCMCRKEPPGSERVLDSPEAMQARIAELEAEEAEEILEWYRTEEQHQES